MPARLPATWVIPRDLTESKFQSKVVEALKIFGWSTMHVRRMFQPDRKVWMTGTSASGWPDVTAIRGAYLLGIELKMHGKYATPDQVEWLDRIANLPYGRSLLLKPSDDWPTICRWFEDPGSAPRRYGYTSRISES